jgi:trehalose-phosphatase
MQVATFLAAQHRPWVVLMRGKEVLEIRPNLPWDKGRAALWWLERRCGPDWPQRVMPIYIGDDRTDEDAFAALAGGGITVAVAPQGPTVAGYYLRGWEEVLDLLRRLATARAGDQPVPAS